MQLSLVAHYGDKPEPLARLILDMQACISGRLAFAFRPYALAQVHGTILGMEGEAGEKGVYNRWFTENTGRRHPIDFNNLIAYLQHELPEIGIRIGGYLPEVNYGFTSRGRHPYLRSFSIQGQIAVAMGWPVTEVSGKPVYSNALYELRRSFERFHLCHKWNTADYQDNDFFFVLGKIDKPAVTLEILEQLTLELRRLMSETPLVVNLHRDSLSLAAYVDTELPIESTFAFPLGKNNLSGEHLMAIYG